MKKIVLLVLLFITNFTYSQVPESFKYQSAIRNSENIVLNERQVGVRFSIIQGMIGGTEVYSETFQTLSNEFGIINLEIGRGQTNDNFENIDWENGPFYIETSIDVEGGTSYLKMGTSQLLSVPYALHAKTADRVIDNRLNSFYVGQDTLGGIVFYVYQTQNGTQKGLIVSKTEIIGTWSNSTNTLIGAASSWDGAANTLLLQGSSGASFAASLGSDWFVPSIDQLSKLAQNRFIINKRLAENGFAELSDYLWSSTEHNKTYAEGYSLWYNWVAGRTKSSELHVRAIREF